MIRKKRIPYLVLIAALLLLLSGCTRIPVQIFNDIIGDSYANADRYAAGDFTYAAADVDAVELCWRVGKVELVQSDGDTLSVSESGGDLDPDARMYHYLDGRTLRIRFCRSGVSVHVASADKHLTVEIPKGIDLSVYNTAADIHAETLEQRSVLVSSSSGNFDCGTLEADSVDISSSSGSFDCGTLEADTMDLSASSGNIRADRVTGNALTLAASSGSMEVGSAALSGPLCCTSSSGDVTLGEIDVGELIVGTTSAKVELRSVLQCPVMGVTTTSGDVEIQAVAQCPVMNVTTTSGKLRLTLPEDGGRVRFATGSGDLRTALPYAIVDDLLFFGDGASEVNVDTTSGDLELK